MNEPRCNECDRTMLEGAIVEYGQAGPYRTVWTLGTQPRLDFWTGGLKGQHYPVRAFRCPDCGILRLYALPDDPA